MVEKVGKSAHQVGAATEIGQFHAFIVA